MYASTHSSTKSYQKYDYCYLYKKLTSSVPHNVCSYLVNILMSMSNRQEGDIDFAKDPPSNKVAKESHKKPGLVLLTRIVQLQPRLFLSLIFYRYYFVLISNLMLTQSSLRIVDSTATSFLYYNYIIYV